MNQSNKEQLLEIVRKKKNEAIDTKLEIIDKYAHYKVSPSSFGEWFDVNYRIWAWHNLEKEIEQLE